MPKPPLLLPMVRKRNSMVFKNDLINALSERNKSLPRESIAKAVDMIQSEIVDSLSKGGRVEIRGFGSFFLSHRRARVARNPKTGSSVSVGKKWLPRFKPGKKLRDAVDEARKSS